MVWIPQVGAMDAYEPGHEVTVEVRQPDGSFKPTTVESLGQIRRLERESEQRARNGEGEQLRWRDYSTDRSNRDQNSFGAGPGQAPSAAAKARFGRRAMTVSKDEPDAPLGPGVSEAASSALADP